MNIHLKTLLKDWPCTVYGQMSNAHITAVTEQASKVTAGSVFIARKGKVTDGRLYIKEALDNGAVAIVVDRPPEEPWEENVPLIVVTDCFLFLAFAAAELAGRPAESLTVIAVTGTNGKTTVTHYIGQLLQQANRQVAVIGTVGVYFNGVKDSRFKEGLTTLTAEQLHPILKDCVEKGITEVVMEASSMGLVQHRLAYCPIDIGLLLNIGEDHYEEHGGRAPYLRAKQQLVDQADTILVNEDSASCVSLSAHRTHGKLYFSQEQFITYPKNIQRDLDLLVKEDFHFPENIVAALAVMKQLRLPIRQLSLTRPPGRMERIELAHIQVFIDYAHTPDALQHVLVELQPSDRKLIVVFGCGGNRHREKRAKMGEVVSTYTEHVYVTSDNPRHEKPEQIIQDILEGIDQEKTQVVIEVDRQKAIHRAIASAHKGDLVLIAGRGHEAFQQIGQEKIACSDRQIAYEALGKYHL